MTELISQVQQRVFEQTGVHLEPEDKDRRISGGFMEILIISGLSGAGKSRAGLFFRGYGFYIVDNMPAAMILKFAEFCAGGSRRYDRVALVYDVRTANSPTELFAVLDSLKHSSSVCSLLFLEASPETIIKRYKETRRRHPLMKQTASLEAAVLAECELMKPLRRVRLYHRYHASFHSAAPGGAAAEFRKRHIGKGRNEHQHHFLWI